MVREPKRFRLAVRGIDDATLSIIGQQAAPAGAVEFGVKPDAIGAVRVLVTAPRYALFAGSMPVTFALTDLATNETVTHENVFYGPK